MENLTLKEYITENKSRNDIGGIQVIYKFPNGYGASCMNSPMLHSYPFLWEIAVLDKEGHLTYETGLTEDVVVFDSIEETNEFLEKVFNLQE